MGQKRKEIITREFTVGKMIRTHAFTAKPDSILGFGKARSASPVL